MNAPEQSIAQSEKGYVAVNTRPALRLLTCGSVDDGKSTLIERLLFEQKSVFEDQLLALAHDPKKYGTAGAENDFALLLDRLEAEREQGMTIDVAYRYFATRRRSFIIADTPGHEQYTRNMVAGASNSELAVLLVDARKGLLTQSRRHAMIAGLLGIKHVVLAVNKIDLVGFDRSIFEEICEKFSAFANPLGFKQITCIPLSARHGDNVSSLSARTPWYTGPHLLDFLETVDVEDRCAAKPFRMSVQLVNQSNADFRGFAGVVASGSIRPGEEIVVLPSAHRTRVKSIIGPQGELDRGQAGDSITITLMEQIDVVRGDMFATALEPPQVADQFAAHLIWISATHLLPERSYLMKIDNSELTARVTSLKHKIDVNTFAQLAAKTLGMNEIGVCNLTVARQVAFDAYANNRSTGAFILIDRDTNQTLAAGMIDFALRRASNIHRQAITISKTARAGLMHHKPAVLWFTGLPSAGKSTIANLVEARLHAEGVHTLLLDGDNIRHGLNRDLGFTEEDRVENIRRVGEVVKLMTDAGLIVLCSFISPFRAERRMVRELLQEDEFVEIFVDTPIAECIARDPKGLYRRALAGEIRNFTGVDQPYETPENPEIHLYAGRRTAEQLANYVIEKLFEKDLLGRL